MSLRAGYHTVPVNQAAQEIERRPCFARVQEIQPPVDGVVVMTSPTLAGAVVC